MSEKIKSENILEELKEQTKWLKFLALSQLKKIIQETLKTKEQKRIYEFTDGKNSTHDISKKLLAESIKVSHMTVYNYWKKWASLSIVIPSGKYSGRFEKIIDLKILDIK